MASQEFIKQWGTNGGGFFNANSAHPFENPTPLTNFIAMFSIFAISAGLTWTLGEHDRIAAARLGGLGGDGVSLPGGRDGRVLGGGARESAAGGRRPAGVGQLQPGGNMEGKEVRFGIANSALFATVTTDASCGAVNSMHDSFTPIGGMVPLVNIMLGEVIFGGVGAGLYGMLVFVILAVFIAGLMVGRTPEYLGKKVDAFDVKMAMLAVLIVPADDPRADRHLGGVAVVRHVEPLESRAPTGSPKMLYAFTSGTGNNGSAFAGLSANTQLVQHDARHRDAVRPVPDHHSRCWRWPETWRARSACRRRLGTFPVTTPLFATLLVGVILIVGALTFFPALSLGPIVEHLVMRAGTAICSDPAKPDTTESVGSPSGGPDRRYRP